MSTIVWLLGAWRGEGGPERSALGNLLAVISAGGRSTALVADAGEGWRLLSCHFVHTSAAHLVFNLAFLFPVGGAVEQVLARRDYIALVVAAAGGSALCSMLGTPQVSAGASGLVFAMLGAAVALGLRHGARLPSGVRLHFGGWVLPFLLIVLAVSSTNPTVDHFSHAGGLTTGLLLGLSLPLAGDRRPGLVRPIAAVAGLALLVTLAPTVATRGQGPVHVRLDDGSAMEVPLGWRSRFGPRGEMQFVSSGGLVVLATGRSPGGSWRERSDWYVRNRLAPTAAAGHVTGLTRGALVPLTTAATSGVVVRYGYTTLGVAMARDVYFLSAHTIVSLELPLGWASKYEETRAAIVGSLRPAPSPAPPLGNAMPQTAAAAARP